MNSQKFSVPPTGFMVAYTILFPENNRYSISTINQGIEGDKKYGNNIMRDICASVNNVARNYGESRFLETEFQSVESIREFARRFQIDPKSLSVPAQRNLNLGYVPQDSRIFHMKELNFEEEEEDPLIVFSKRRKSSLESKIAKTLARVADYRNAQSGQNDKDFSKLKKSIITLEESCEYDLLSWRNTSNIPFEAYDVCACDFAAITYVVNNLGKSPEDGELQELSKETTMERMDIIESYARSKNGIIIRRKDNFSTGGKDRAVSYTTYNPRNGRAFESRIITPRDIVEATIGNSAHDGYKVMQQGKVEELRRKDNEFAEIVNNAVEFSGQTNVSELFSK